MSNRSLVAVVTALVVSAFVISDVMADYPSAILADNPVGYWRLGEAAGPNAIDQTANVDLTYTLFTGGFGQPGGIAGDTDTSVKFTPDAAGDPGLGVPSPHPTLVSPSITDFGFASGESFSIEYWIRATADNTSTDGAGIITKGYDEAKEQPWYLSRYTGGKVDFFLRNPDDRQIVSASNVNDDRWHHVVGVYDSASTSINLYVDGLLEASRSDVNPNAYGSNSRPFSVGNHFNRGLDAWLDEVAVYDSALTADQVLGHALAGGAEINVPDVLNVDFGSSLGSGGGPGGLQVGFVAFEDTESAGTADVTRSYRSKAGTSGKVDVPVGGFTHFRDYSGLAGGSSSISPLASDMVLRNRDGTMTLTMDNLKSGTYEITTYHHSSQFGGGALDIQLSDANGVGQNVAMDVPVSSGTEPASISSSSFNLVSDGSAVSIDFLGGEGSQHLSLNGFRLREADLRQRIPVLAVDVNDRGASEATDPTVTQAGFQEFVLDGTENDDINTPTTRSFGPLTVTLSSAAGQNHGDRRRAEPSDGGLFTDQELLRDFVFARGDTEDDGLDVLMEGLKPKQLYEVTVWSFDDSSASTRVANWYANGELAVESYAFDGNAVPPSPAFNDVYSFEFTATADEKGDLLIAGRQAGSVNPGVFLNGFALSEVVPEPSCALLLGIGLFALGLCRPRES